MPSPIVGQSHELTFVVKEERCANAMGSGSVNVLATPVLVRAAEKASRSVLEGCLEKGDTTVGAYISMEHLAPTAADAWVRVRSTLCKIEGRVLTFSIEARDCAGLVARGEHRRVIVDRARFEQKAQKRIQQHPDATAPQD